MEINDTTNWMTNDDNDWLMQNSHLHGLLLSQSLILIVMLTLPFLLYNIWKIISSFILLK